MVCEKSDIFCAKSYRLNSMIVIFFTVILLVNLYALVEIFLGMKRLRSLNNIVSNCASSLPSVSIIVPACNEEETIEPALRSLLALDYDNIEIIVVNDRSTDNTSGVLKNLQREFPALQILTITELPEDWLGKTNALYQGAQQARGEYLLFTDADILFAQTTLSRAMSLVVNERLDHLSLVFKNIAKGLLLNAMIVDAGSALFFLFKPWKVRDPKSKNFMGVGAFNLIRKSTYTAIGGHRSIRMHPIDDIMLGKVVKQSGFQQECLTAYDFLQVHWYDSTAKMIQGLMKNIFALYDFKIVYTMFAVIMVFVLTILPVWGVFFCTGATRIVCLLSVCLRLLSTALGAKNTRTSFKIILYSLLTPYINIYIMITGIVTTVTGDGIQWRGVHYPLDKLKKSMSILKCRHSKPPTKKACILDSLK